MTTDHFTELRTLLALERREEEARTKEALAGKSARQLQLDGVCLLGLDCEDVSYSGVEETLIVTLQRADSTQLPFHSLRVGSRVALSTRAEPAPETVLGTVMELRRSELRVALDREPEGDLLSETLTVTLTADDVSLRRTEDALAQVEGAREGRLKEMRRVVVLGERAPEFDSSLGQVDSWFDPGLNDSQKEAVSHALAARHIALIHGPPGTGKTRTTVELIRQTVARDQTVLATAPSNIAVDNLLERLSTAGVKVLRVGHPARTRQELRAHGFDALVEATVDPDVQKALRAEERSLLSQVKKARAGRRALYGQLRELRREMRTLHRDARRNVLASAQVVLATCNGAATPLLADLEFDLAVIDEAAQCVEPLAYVPMARAERLVLAGDHLQLPPTILSVDAERRGLGKSLFERIAERGDPLSPEHPARLLAVQYRMHGDIMNFLSQHLYGGKLVAHELVVAHAIDGLPTLMFIDTAGASFDEERVGDGGSFANPREAHLLVEHLRERVLPAGLDVSDVAVIAPYSGQVELLRTELAPEREAGDAAQGGLEIDTVDGFQGREKEAVLVSLVRSNPEGTIGFLSEVRRLNVALSRARKHLWVIGDSATLARHPFYAALLEHCEQVGGYNSAWSYM